MRSTTRFCFQFYSRSSHQKYAEYIDAHTSFQFYSRSSNKCATLDEIKEVITFNSIVDHPKLFIITSVVSHLTSFNSIVDHLFTPVISSTTIRTTFQFYSRSSCHCAKKDLVSDMAVLSIL